MIFYQTISCYKLYAYKFNYAQIHRLQNVGERKHMIHEISRLVYVSCADSVNRNQKSWPPKSARFLLRQIMWCLHKHFLVQQAQWHLRRLIFSQVIDHQIQPCLRNDIQQGRQDLKQGSSPDSSDSWMLAAQVKEKTKRGGSQTCLDAFQAAWMAFSPLRKTTRLCCNRSCSLRVAVLPGCFKARRWGKSSVALGPQYIAMLNRKMMIRY